MFDNTQFANQRQAVVFHRGLRDWIGSLTAGNARPTSFIPRRLETVDELITADNLFLHYFTYENDRMSETFFIIPTENLRLWRAGSKHFDSDLIVKFIECYLYYIRDF